MRLRWRLSMPISDRNAKHINQKLNLMNTKNKIISSLAHRLVVVALFVTFTSYYCFAQTAVQRGGFLKTATISGKTYVCNSNGAPFSMAGVDLYWSNWDNKFYNASTVNYFVDNWKISVIRCAIGVAYTPSETGFTTTAVPGGIVLDYNTNVSKAKAVVDQAIARGIYVILDWHVEGKASPYINTAKQFYKEMAEKYSSYPNIIYEVYNEPARDGNDQSSINAYDQEMVDYIRQYDKKNLIICGSNTWSQYPNQVSITGANAYNICYTFHAYPDNEPGHLTQFYNNVPDAQSHGKAVFITELSGKGSSFGNTATIMDKCKEWNIPVTTWEAIDNGEDWSIFCSGSGTSCLTSLGQMFKDKCLGWPAIPVVDLIHPTAIAFNPNTATLPSVGSTVQLSLAFTPSATSDQSAIYSSSNTAVASVDASGKVTAVSAGTAIITATANDKTNGTLTASCTVTVKNLSNIALSKSVTVSSSESATYPGSNAVDGNTTTRWASAFSDPQWIQIDLGASYKIYNVILNWEAASAKDYAIQISADGSTGWTTIATKTGMATGARVDNLSVAGTGRYIKMNGTARTSIYGYSLFEFGVYGESDVVIPVTGVNISPTSVSVATNSTSQLSAVVAPSNATNQNVTWASSNTAVATVNTSGLVTGISSGSATVTVTTVDGSKTDVCTVTVSNVAVTGVTVSPATVSVGVNSTSQLSATVTPSNAANKNVTWSSNNTAVATVSSTGLVTGVSNGTAVITAKTVDGAFTSTSAITVTNVTNKLTNGDFSNGITGWTTYVDPAASGTFSVVSGQLFANITNGGSQVWHVQAYQGNLNIVNGQTYTLSFTARATANRSISAVVEQNGGAYTLYGGGNNNFNITTTNAAYSFTFTMAQPTDVNGRVTFNLGNNSSSVYIDNVVLSGSSSGFSLKIEAESFASKTAAPQAETTSDVGGGQDMGWIGNTDYLIYNVNIPTAGTYTISYRVASPNTTGKVILGKNGTDLTPALAVPNTGGWQAWQTITTTATLAAGTQSFTVYAQTGGFNINWWSIASTAGRLASDISEESVENSFAVYPNPSLGSVTIRVIEPAQVKIHDVSGKIFLDIHVEENITVSDLHSGLYIIRMQSKTGSKTEKLVVK
jgi:uncharacterized protein YjdB